MVKKVLTVAGVSLLLASCQSKVEKIQSKADNINSQIESITNATNSVNEKAGMLTKGLIAEYDSLSSFRRTLAYSDLEWDKVSDLISNNLNAQLAVFETPEYSKLKAEYDSIVAPIDSLKGELVILAAAMLEAKMEEAGK